MHKSQYTTSINIKDRKYMKEEKNFKYSTKCITFCILQGELKGTKIMIDMYITSIA